MIIFIHFYSPIIVSAGTTLQAAFIRDHQLWFKKEDEEIQITTDRYARSPKWSYDGRFIAYIDGGVNGKDSNLFIYDTKEKENYQPYGSTSTFDFKWSPVKNQLAFTDQGLLQVTKTRMAALTDLKMSD